MENLRFAQATQDDLELLVDLRLKAMRPSLEAIGRFNPDRARQRFTDEYVPEHTRLILQNGKFVGCFALLPRDKHLYLGHFYLLPETQGRGIGKFVMGELLGVAKALKQPIKLIVLENSPAISFYEQFGFEISEQDGVDITMEWSSTRSS